MSKESRDYLEMSFRSVRLFADDGTFSHANLQEIIDIALRDGRGDDARGQGQAGKPEDPSRLTRAGRTVK